MNIAHSYSNSNMSLNGQDLFSTLQTCKKLSELTLSSVTISNPPVFTAASISLRQLRVLTMRHCVAGTVLLLCAFRDLPQDLSVKLCLTAQDFTTVLNAVDFQLNFCPLSFSRADIHPDRVSLSPPVDLPKVRIHVTVIFGHEYEQWSGLESFIPNEMLENPVLQVLYVHSGTRDCTDRWSIPLAQLPPFKQLVVTKGTATEVFGWLRTFASKERLRVVEAITLDGVYLAIIKPGRLVKEILPDDRFRHWDVSYRALDNLREILRRRHEERRPVNNLTLLRIHCDQPDAVKEAFSPLVESVVVHELWNVLYS